MEKLLKRLFVFIVSFFLLFSISSCGNDEQQDGFQVAGEWTGTWQANTVNGDVEVTLLQNGSEIIGTGYLNGSPCLNEVSIWGVLDEETREIYFLFLDPEISDANMRTLNPLNPSSSFKDMSEVLTANGNFSTEEHLSLTFEVVEWDFCDGSNGVINLDRR